MDKSLWEILIPVASNNGENFSSIHNAPWYRKVLELAGGYTKLLPVEGVWKAPDGIVFYEMMLPVRILCTKSEIENIVDFTITHYEQLAVMYYKISSECIIKEK